jgi:hypothetical protein
MDNDQVLPHLATWVQEVTGHEPQISEGEYDEDDLRMMVVLTTLRPEILLDAAKAIHPTFEYPAHVPDPAAILVKSLESFFGRDKHALGLSKFGVEDDSFDELDAGGEENCHDSQVRQCVRLLLGCAVQGPRKAEHVQAIMQQSPDTQRVLMLEIEAVMTALAAPAGETNECDKEGAVIALPASADEPQQQQDDTHTLEGDEMVGQQSEEVSVSPTHEGEQGFVATGDGTALEEQNTQGDAELEDLKVQAKRLERVNRAVKLENSEIEDELNRTKSRVQDLEEELNNAKDALAQYENEQVRIDVCTSKACANGRWMEGWQILPTMSS